MIAVQQLITSHALERTGRQMTWEAVARDRAAGSGPMMAVVCVPRDGPSGFF